VTIRVYRRVKGLGGHVTRSCGVFEQKGWIGRENVVGVRRPRRGIVMTLRRIVPRVPVLGISTTLYIALHCGHGYSHANSPTYTTPRAGLVEPQWATHRSSCPRLYQTLQLGQHCVSLPLPLLPKLSDYITMPSALVLTRRSRGPRVRAA